jgi:uncharacterized membrane protein YuzA (DUF378 family)
VFRRKSSTTQRLQEAGSDLLRSGASGAKSFAGRPHKLDSYAAGALALGVSNWISMSLFNFDAVKAVAGSRSMSGRTLYGVLGLSALYATVRGTRKASS